MDHPQYFKNLLDNALACAEDAAKNASIGYMEQFLEFAKGDVTHSPFKLSHTFVEGVLSKIDAISKIGYTLGFEKSVKLAKSQAEKGNVLSMKNAMALAQKCGLKINKDPSNSFSSLEDKAYLSATNKMVDYAYDFLSKNNFSGLNKALFLADIYSKKSGVDISGDVALIKNASKNNYSNSLNRCALNYVAQTGPINFINNN